MKKLLPVANKIRDQLSRLTGSETDSSVITGQMNQILLTKKER